jgi:hypothetical protein
MDKVQKYNSFNIINYIALKHNNCTFETHVTREITNTNLTKILHIGSHCLSFYRIPNIGL